MHVEEAKIVAEKHWEFINNLLVAAGYTPDELHKFLFIRAMIHGIKHGAESSSIQEGSKRSLRPS